MTRPKGSMFCAISSFPENFRSSVLSPKSSSGMARKSRKIKLLLSMPASAEGASLSPVTRPRNDPTKFHLISEECRCHNSSEAERIKTKHTRDIVDFTCFRAFIERVQEILGLAQKKEFILKIPTVQVFCGSKHSLTLKNSKVMRVNAALETNIGMHANKIADNKTHAKCVFCEAF